MSRKSPSLNTILQNNNWMDLRCINMHNPCFRKIIDVKRNNLVVAEILIMPKADTELTQKYCNEVAKLTKEYFANYFLNM